MTLATYSGDYGTGDGGEEASFLERIVTRWRSEPLGVFAVYIHKGLETVVLYEQVEQRSRQFLSLLRAKGLEKGDLVFLIIKDTIDAHAAFIGAMLGGFVPSLLPYPNAKQDIKLYWRQHRAVFTFSEAVLAVTFDEIFEQVAECASGTRVRVASSSEIGLFEPAADCKLPDPDDIAFLQHSSGTTGLKKGVALTYRTVTLQLSSYAKTLRLAEQSLLTVATWLPLYHDMGLISSFLLPCWFGIKIVSLDPFAWISSPTSLLDVISRYRATHVWLPNFAFLVLARGARHSTGWDLSCLRAVVNCSEPCKPASFDAFTEKFSAMGLRPEALKACYAMAENVFAVSQTEACSAPRRLSVSRTAMMAGRVQEPASDIDTVQLVSCGFPIETCRVQISGATESDETRVGEILVQAPFTFHSYHRNTAATQAAWRDGWYCTGDLGFLNEGEIFVVGRIKDVIIVNGKNIFAHDVETAVSSTPGVKAGRCVALGWFNQRVGSEQIVVIAERDASLTTDANSSLALAISQAVSEECGTTCSDVRIVGVDWLVKTTSGKISRSENAAKYMALLGSEPASPGC